MAVSGTDPVRWWLFDDAVPPIADGVPDADSSVWEARYDNLLERGKRTTRNFEDLPVFGGTTDALRSRFAHWSNLLGYPVYDDPQLHGGGLHVTAPGGRLATHVDYALHPDGKSLRALNLIAFVHPEWRPEWGGNLYLADGRGAAVREFEPKPGRVVAFEVSDLSYHGVRPTAPEAAERVSLAVYYLCALETTRACDAPRHTRRSAQFLPCRT